MTSASVLRPLVLGVVTGLRSQLGLAVLAWSEPASGRDTAGAAAAALDPRPRADRCRRGGRAGRGQAAEHAEPARSRRAWPSGCSPAPGSVRWPRTRPTGARSGSRARSGVAGAAAGTYAGAYYRKLLPARTHTPDLPWAVGEDAVAAGLAATAIKVWPEPRPWWQRAPRAALARASRSGRRPRAPGPSPEPPGPSPGRPEGRRPGPRRRAEGRSQAVPAGRRAGRRPSREPREPRCRDGDVPAAVIGTAAEPG